MRTARPGQQGSVALLTAFGSCLALLAGLALVVVAVDVGVAAARARAGADAAALAAAAALPLAGGDGDLEDAAARLAAANGARLASCCHGGSGPRQAPHAAVTVEVAVPARTVLLRGAAVELRARAAAALRPVAGPLRLPEVGHAPPSAGTGRLQVPVRAHLTSGFGWRRHPVSGARRLHAGVDLAAPTGAPVAAAGDGVVVRVGWHGGYGLSAVVDHGGGLSTRYAHLSRAAVSPGQAVHRGDLLGHVGCTGTCTGPHLHFEVRRGGRPTDPLPYLS